MEQKTLVERLADVEKHIAIGKLHIDRQQQLIDELVRNGEPAANERALLATFKKLLAEHEARRADLVRALKTTSGQSGIPTADDQSQSRASTPSDGVSPPNASSACSS